MKKRHQISHLDKAKSRVQSVSHLLDINLNVFLQVVAIQVKDQVVDKVKTVTDDDERQLVSKFGFLSITHIGKKKNNKYVEMLGSKTDFVERQCSYIVQCKFIVQ